MHVQQVAGTIVPTAEPVGYAHEIRAEGPPNPTSLRSGSLVYLWQPGEVPGSDEPMLARVERATMDTIIARDLGGDRSRRSCPVSAMVPVGLRWSWKLAAEPEQPSIGAGGVAIIDRRAMSVSERREWLFGPAGTTVRITTKDGANIVGVPTEIVVDGDEWEPVYVFIEGPTDMRGQITHRVVFDQIAAVTIQGNQAAA